MNLIMIATRNVMLSDGHWSIEMEPNLDNRNRSTIRD